MMMGGRAAEQVVLGDETTGAESDIDQITHVVRHMAGRWGMSDAIGMVAVLPRDDTNPWGDHTSPGTRELLDAEVRNTIDRAYAEVTALLEQERPRLDALADALLERETLDQIDAYRIVDLAEPGAIAID